jgi:3-hydroxyacyl-[acyl-carrier-protein] dehydratase
MKTEEIIGFLPYAKPFLFVDSIESISDTSVIGTFKFDASLDFYQGHLINFPITPGVILIETMAQIGLVCLGIYLSKDAISSETQVLMSSAKVDFLKPVFPNEKVTVFSELEYFRFQKLRCKVKMENENREVVCQGIIDGFVIHPQENKQNET